VTPFIWRSRVYWEDTDAGGVVYYANYLKFLERARTEWLRARGIAQSQLAASEGVVFAVIEVGIRYLRPARLDDELCISCEPAREGGVSMQFVQRIWRPAEPEALLIEAEIRVACLDAAAFRPRRLPAIVLAEFPE
jgi:acyl-CoA thioester hydrolase